MVLVRNWLHNRSDCEAVEIVIDEDEHTEKTGGKFCGPFAADFLRGPGSIRLGAARFGNDTDEAPRRAKKEDDVKFIRCADSLCHDLKGERPTISMKPAPVKAQ